MKITPTHWKLTGYPRQQTATLYGISTCLGSRPLYRLVVVGLRTVLPDVYTWKWTVQLRHGRVIATGVSPSQKEAKYRAVRAFEHRHQNIWRKLPAAASLRRSG